MIAKATKSKLFTCGIALFVALPIAAVRAEPSTAMCKHYAENYANRESTGQLFGHAVGGTVLGAGIGAIFGGAGAGAVIGGGLGAIRGGARQSSTYKQAYVDAFVDCMAGHVPTIQ